MLILPYVRFFGIECRKDTLLSTAAIVVSLFICLFATLNRLTINNALTRRDLIDTINSVVRDNSKLSVDLASHVDLVVQRQLDQDANVKKLLDQEQLNQTRLQEIVNSMLKSNSVRKTPQSKVDD